MSNGLDQDNGMPFQKPSGNPEDVKKDFKGLLGSTKAFLADLLDIRSNTDQEATKEAIIADIPFKGHTSWILICSILVASLGLAKNSPAVVIGAMLISPLMGPILGVGMSLAINDIDTLRRSLKNFTVMVVLSVLTAYIFFLLPLDEETSELIARTEPDILDVLIAFFGGSALVIARAKKGTIASVIFGVAIATALMPPLCTVGFGLAIGNLVYAGAAMFLFLINSIFIALATFLIIKLLRFPMVRYANSQKRRLIARMASLLALVVMVPAGYTFYRTFQESLFKRQANDFIASEIATYQFMGEGRFLEDFTDIEYNEGENPVIELVFMGNETIPEGVIATWNKQKNDYYSKLQDTELQVIQGGKNEAIDQFKYATELYESQKSILVGKDEKIRLLESELSRLKRLESKQIPFKDISNEARANHKNLLSLEYSSALRTDFKKTDTLTIFEAKWKRGTSRSQMAKDNKQLLNWLRVRLKDTLVQLRN